MKQRQIETGSLLGQTGGVVGLDEAGRGCLAGPVVAGAVMFAPGFDIIGLDDSKVLSEEERERLAGEIRALAPAWGLGIVWMKDIESRNILQASLLAMARALAALKRRAGGDIAQLLIDGNQLIPGLYFRMYGLGAPRQRAIVHGDALEPCISAASILAKTFRDKLMLGFDKRWPEYGFARHKGYGTKEHREALQKHGSCPLHRKDFRGVREEKTGPEQGWLC